MRNPNVFGWIGQVEKLENKKQYERPFHQDELQFYLFHPPMPTENGKALKEQFNQRKELENEKSELKEKERKLVNKFDDLNRELKKAQEKPAETPEEKEQKMNEIARIQEEIKKVIEELKDVKEEIQEVENQIDDVNVEINKLIEINIEDEHKAIQQEQEIEKQKNDKEVNNLINQL